MARPKKDESIRRTHNVMVRFTDVEYALVSCSAEQAGYPVAVYVRKQAITEKLHVHYNIVADIAELRDFARQLSHIGNNLNQIAAFFNSGGIQSRAMLEEINRCIQPVEQRRFQFLILRQYRRPKPPAQQGVGNRLDTDTFLPIVQGDTVSVDVVTALMHQPPHSAVLAVVHDGDRFRLIVLHK